MTLPGQKRNRIIRPDWVHPFNQSLNPYQCEYCRETQWGKDGDPPHEAWRENHRSGMLCFREKPKMEIVPDWIMEPTETKMINLIRSGDIIVLRCLDPEAKRNIRYEWYRKA
jgi:hypothetical protein